VHYFVVIYPKKEDLINNIPKAIEAFNGQNDKFYNLKIGNLIFNDDYSMVLVNEFGQMNEAVSYYKNFLQKEVVKLADPTIKIYNFVITKDNFQILYQTKGINDYLEFFRKNY
jgi:hypothetical protein